jgi:hypothetical protein
MMIDTYLTAQQIMEQTGLSAAELAALPMDEYARLSGRPTVAQSTPPAPQTPDFVNMSMDDYAAYRQQAGIGVSQKERRGIFDSAPSQSQAYTNAAHVQAARTAMSNVNVEQPRRVDGRYLNLDEQRDTRSKAQRFSTPGNSYQPW